MAKAILKKGREESLLRFHPWVFSGAIAQYIGKVAEGDVIAVYASDGSLLGCGHYQVGSIAVRMLSFTSDHIDDDSFWVERISAALRVRKACGLPSEKTTCYRLVHGEGDALPGLIVDWYDGVCVMQAHSVGMFRAARRICEALQSVYGPELRAVYNKSAATVPFKAGLDAVDGYLYKTEGYTEGEGRVLENGYSFLVDWDKGQKTGFFLDQRASRSLVGSLSKGRRVLNLFCYTGGFSVYSLGGGAQSCDSVDSSARAIELCERNIALNGFASSHKSHCCDAIDFLDKEVKQGEFDLMVVDPPAFAKHRGAVDNALRAYRKLNAKAIEKVAPGGLVFTFSCSQAVDREAFSLAVFSAAASSGRRVRILSRLGQGFDHAVSIYHPEGEYLKGLALYVE